MKFIHKNGKEVVYDGDKPHTIIYDSRYKGTYNYVNIVPKPKKWTDIKEVLKFGVTFIGHGVADVLPYKIGGNVRGKH